MNVAGGALTIVVGKALTLQWSARYTLPDTHVLLTDSCTVRKITEVEELQEAYWPMRSSSCLHPTSISCVFIYFFL